MAVRPIPVFNSYEVLVSLESESAWPSLQTGSDRPVFIQHRATKDSLLCSGLTTDTPDLQTSGPLTTDTPDTQDGEPLTTDTLDDCQCPSCEVATTFAPSRCQHSCCANIGELPNAPASAEPGKPTPNVHSSNNSLGSKDEAIAQAGIPGAQGFTLVTSRKRARRKYVALCTKDEVLLQSVAKEVERPGYRLVEAVLESGAEDSVSAPKFFPGPVVPSAMSKAGGSYRVANGQRVPNIGQQSVHFRTDEGLQAGMLFQTAEIERPLISASQLAASGNNVVFNKKGCTIVHEQSGKSTLLHKRGGIYVLRMWIPIDSDQSFPGRGR